MGALAFAVLGWRERAALRALRHALLRKTHPVLQLAPVPPTASALPLLAEDAVDGKKYAVIALGVTAYRDSASQALAYVRVAE